MSRPLRCLGWVSLPLLLPLLSAGCASDDPRPPKSEPMEVKVGSQGRVFESATSPVAAALVSGVKKRLEQRRIDDARELAARFPTELLEVLAEAPVGAVNEPLYLLLARVRDRLDGVPRAAGWEAHLVAMTQAPERWKAYAEARRARRELLRRRDWDEVLDHETPVLGGPLAELRRGEVLFDQALALEGDNELDSSLEALEAAEGSFARNAPDLALRVRLRRVALLRRLGRTGPSDALWQECAAKGQDLLARRPPLCDVTGWERILALRPTGSSWPEGLLATARRHSELELGPPGAGDPIAASLWATLGAWRGARREYRESLMAYLQAEEACGGARGREKLRLEQARLMIRLDETGAAAAVLGGLSASPRSEIAAPALALLGSIHLRGQQLREAAHLLRQAVGEGAPAGFRGRGEAEADLGLAELLLGREDEGLRWLRAAQRRFRSEGARRQLERALRNELRYHEFSQHEDEVERLKGDLTRLTQQR